MAEAGAMGHTTGSMNVLPAQLYRKIAACFLMIVVLTSHTCSEIPRPRGVAISKASFYVGGADFTCLDGSATIPLERVNDDYCDCPGDGSDEPGTSACPNGSFHCTNAGYKPQNIPSSWVNDGICDCCDGTDEYEGITACENNCKEMGRQMREELEQVRKLEEEGHKIYQDYCQRGQEALKEKQLRLEELEKEKADLEEKKTALEEYKNEVEGPEREAKDRHQKAWDEEKQKQEAEKELVTVQEAFNNLDQDNNGVCSVAEMQQQSCFDIDNNGEVSEEEGKEYLEDQDQVDFDTFKDKVWPNIKEIYKKDKQASEPSEPSEPVTDEPPTPTPTPDPVPEPPSYNDDDHPHDDDDEEYRDYDDEDEDMEDEDDSYPTPSPDHGDPEDDYTDNYNTKDDDDTDDLDTDNNNSKQGDDAMPEYDDETKQLIEAADKARVDFNEVDRQFKDVERELKDLQNVVELDLGPNKEYFPLKGECYEFTDSQYTYKLCPFDRASQRSKHGGSETSLGSWGHWDGTETNKYSAMKYTRGQNCWNGPDRSAKVVIGCGLVSELLGASEPNRCEYEFKFRTPAACSSSPDPPPRDEL